VAAEAGIHVPAANAVDEPVVPAGDLALEQDSEELVEGEELVVVEEEVLGDDPVAAEADDEPHQP